MIAKLRRKRAQDEGISLVELIVSTMIFAMILAIITTTIMTMMHDQQRENGIGANLDSSRKLIETLDRQVRYANAITTPGTGTDGGYYVEFRTGNANQQQTCTQLRYLPSTGVVAYRTWLPPLGGTGSVTASSWITLAFNVSPPSGNTIWSITPSASTSNRTALTANFVTSNGAPATSTSSQVTITALNTSSSSASTTVCNEVGRP